MRIKRKVRKMIEEASKKAELRRKIREVDELLKAKKKKKKR